MGIFISIEGLDASGKHTQTEKLKTYFEKQTGKNVVKFDFPKYASITGEMIKGHLTGDWRAEMTDNYNLVFRDHSPTYALDVGTYLFQCCQITNRLECLPDQIWNQAVGDVFIADRYNASAYAYGKAFGLDLDWLFKIHKHLPQPDLNVFLDITVEESFARRPERRDNYEKNATMLNDVRNCYIDIFKQLGSSYAIIDAAGSVDDVFSKILDQLSSRGLL